ncbi:hypothetical protein QBC47DRAFT_311625, partial [Echria macrotheca]
AKAFCNLGKYAEVEAINWQALQLYEKVPDNINKLALVLKWLGKYKETEQMYRQVLQLKERVLGKKHPSTLRNKNNLRSLSSIEARTKTSFNS